MAAPLCRSPARGLSHLCRLDRSAGAQRVPTAGPLPTPVGQMPTAAQPGLQPAAPPPEPTPRLSLPQRELADPQAMPRPHRRQRLPRSPVTAGPIPPRAQPAGCPRLPTLSEPQRPDSRPAPRTARQPAATIRTTCRSPLTDLRAPSSTSGSQPDHTTRRLRHATPLLHHRSEAISIVRSWRRTANRAVTALYCT